MSQIMRPAYRPNNGTRDFIVAVRSGRHGGVDHGAHGTLACGHCGAGGMSKRDFEIENDLPPGSVNKFLDRKLLRTDVADSIRANVMRVLE